jgi:hypothetical protein
MVAIMALWAGFVNGVGVKTSKPVGVGSGIVKNNFLIRLAVEHNPIALNMAIGKSLIVAGKFMLAAANRQRLTPNEKRYNIKDFVYVFMAFFH